MKRSEINALMRNAVEFMARHKFLLPSFAYWTPDDWQSKGHEADEVRDCQLGWDLTDFGQGKFDEIGLVIFAIRNGHYSNDRYPKPYAEKILIVAENQITPMHFHWKKSEDIINRGGGNMMIQLYNSDENEGLADTDVVVSMDGVQHTFPAGETVRVAPGQSITILHHCYHKFWGEPGTGRSLIGEVSAVNDDNTDNRFYEGVGRFPEIEEDAPPLYLLWSEYPKA
jgi:D-lyxose ketol-isomerase